jgi:hypothetical protein
VLREESNSYLHVPNVDCIENVEISTSESENKNTHHVVSKYYIGSSDIHRPVQTQPLIKIKLKLFPQPLIYTHNIKSKVNKNPYPSELLIRPAASKQYLLFQT